MTHQWGLMGPDQVPSTRRARTLSLGKAVRFFNDQAVPGLGNLWFAKQLVLAALGIAVAEKAREGNPNLSNTQVANAIEALACLLTFQENQWKSDARLRGSTKLSGKEISTFKIMSKPSFYVSQPMRMATVQPLLALGLTESYGNSARFNAYHLTSLGKEILETAFAGYRPYNKPVVDVLSEWVLGKKEISRTEHIVRALSPTEPLSDAARMLLKECFMTDSNEQQTRRHHAYLWMQNYTDTSIDWDRKPSEIDEDHWRDMRAGALFFCIRDAALAVLDALEQQITRATKREVTPSQDQLSDEVTARLADLEELAQQYVDSDFLSLNHDTHQFCSLCLTEPDATLTELVRRDGVVLRLSMDERKIVPSSAFGSAPASVKNGQDSSPEVTVGNDDLPTGISYRIHNLRLLVKDFDNQLDALLMANAGDNT